MADGGEREDVGAAEPGEYTAAEDYQGLAG